MKGGFSSLLWVLALLALPRAPVCAMDLSLPDPVGYGKRIVRDLEELPAKPRRWTSSQWYLAGGIVTLTGVSFLFDEEVRDYFERNRPEDLRHVSQGVTHFGDHNWQVPILAGFWLGGRAFNSPIMAKLAADGTEASAISALLITPTLCYISGRALPSRDEDAMRFKPFSPGRYSFPSGHTTAAFSLATVLDIDLRGTFGYWHTPVVYGLALGVAASRVYDEKHYLSEVLLGGSIGWAVGSWIASKERRGPPASLTLLPYPAGARLAYQF